MFKTLAAKRQLKTRDVSNDASKYRKHMRASS